MLPFRRLAPLLLAAPLAACGPAVGPEITTADEREFVQAISALAAGESTNGMSMNGMSMNGMSMNGLSLSGLAQTGLTPAGLDGAAFRTWFDADPKLRSVTMKYLVRCAAPATRSFTYRSAANGVTYTWPGNLGVAPGWVAGKAITTAEQQVVSACLAAHVNKFSVQIGIGVEGKAADGSLLPMAAGELTTYALRESCFFGNLFTGEGIYAGIDHAAWDRAKSSPRACAFDYAGVGTDRECPPIFLAGACASLCRPGADGISYDTCTVNGKTFRALTTRIATTSKSTCGDGRCDPQERCGTGTTWDDCGLDCGACGPGAPLQTY
jgi:hypothetical protein